LAAGWRFGKDDAYWKLHPARQNPTTRESHDPRGDSDPRASGWCLSDIEVWLMSDNDEDAGDQQLDEKKTSVAETQTEQTEQTSSSASSSGEDTNWVRKSPSVLSNIVNQTTGAETTGAETAADSGFKAQAAPQAARSSVVVIDEPGFEILDTPRRGADTLEDTVQERGHDKQELVDLDMNKHVLPFLATTVMGYVVNTGSDYRAASAAQLAALAEEMQYVPTVKHPNGAETGCVFLGNFGRGGGSASIHIANTSGMALPPDAVFRKVFGAAGPEQMALLADGSMCKLTIPAQSNTGMAFYAMTSAERVIAGDLVGLNVC